MGFGTLAPSSTLTCLEGGCQAFFAPAVGYGSIESSCSSISILHPALFQGGKPVKVCFRFVGARARAPSCGPCSRACMSHNPQSHPYRHNLYTHASPTRPTIQKYAISRAWWQQSYTQWTDTRVCTSISTSTATDAAKVPCLMCGCGCSEWMNE